VLQITEKITTEFPYNVELGHIQPAGLKKETIGEIQKLLSKIASALEFEDCASHTEIKITNRGIKVIETSPRLGGDFITSTLVPASTGLNMEDLLIDISTAALLPDACFVPRLKSSSAVIFIELKEGTITAVHNLDDLRQINGVKDFSFDLKVGDKISRITSSLNRYGHVLIQNNEAEEIRENIKQVKDFITKNIVVT
jgi:carbamoyl-phosphate synthase large subunit